MILFSAPLAVNGLGRCRGHDDRGEGPREDRRLRAIDGESKDSRAGVLHDNDVPDRPSTNNTGSEGARGN